MIYFVYEDFEKDERISNADIDKSEMILLSFQSNPPKSLNPYKNQIARKINYLGKLILFSDSSESQKSFETSLLDQKCGYSVLKPLRERIKRREFKKIPESSLIYLLLDKCLETKSREKVDFRFLKNFLPDLKKAFNSLYKKAFNYYKLKQQKIPKTIFIRKKHQSPDNEFSFKRKPDQYDINKQILQSSNSPKTCINSSNNLFYDSNTNTKIPNPFTNE